MPLNPQLVVQILTALQAVGVDLSQLSAVDIGNLVATGLSGGGPLSFLLNIGQGGGGTGAVTVKYATLWPTSPGTFYSRYGVCGRDSAVTDKWSPVDLQPFIAKDVTFRLDEGRLVASWTDIASGRHRSLTQNGGPRVSDQSGRDLVLPDFGTAVIMGVGRASKSLLFRLLDRKLRSSGSVASTQWARIGEPEDGAQACLINLLRVCDIVANATPENRSTVYFVDSLRVATYFPGIAKPGGLSTGFLSALDILNYAAGISGNIVLTAVNALTLEGSDAARTVREMLISSTQAVGFMGSLVSQELPLLGAGSSAEDSVAISYERRPVRSAQPYAFQRDLSVFNTNLTYMSLSI